jgi:hypothetical protein
MRRILTHQSTRREQRDDRNCLIFYVALPEARNSTVRVTRLPLLSIQADQGGEGCGNDSHAR